MMLNMDPPEHSRLRRLLSRSFTPRAVARLEDGIRGHARAICDRVFTGPRGECDFAKDVAADLPLLALADVLGVPEQDRWLLFDWSNRVIGYQDPDYASSAEFDSSGGTPMAREAIALRPAPDSRGRMPDPRTREGMPDLYAYAHLLAGEQPPPRTANSPGSASARATRWWSRSHRPTGTRRCSTAPTASTSTATPTRTWSSAMARTSAWARISPGPRWPRCCASCSRGRPRCV